MKELDVLKAALELVKGTNRKELLKKWFRSPQGRLIGSDPFRALELLA